MATETIDLYLDGVLTPEEVGELYRVGTNTANAWARNHKLPALQTPGGQWRFSRRAVLEDLASGGESRG